MSDQHVPVAGSGKLNRSVPFNFAMNLILKLSGTICAAVSYPYAFRMIGEAGMGSVAFSASVTSFFVMLASIGVSTYGIRECAKVRDDAVKLRTTARELLALQGIMTLAALFLLGSAVLAVPRLRENGLFFLIQGCMLLFHGLDTEWLFAATERYGFLALRSFAMKLLSVLLVVGFVRSSDDALMYCLFIVGPTVLGNLWNIAGARDYLRGPVESLKPLRHFRASSVFFLQAVAATIYTSLDSALLGLLQNDAAVGAYDAAVKIRTILVFAVTSLGTVLLPRFSYYVGEKKETELHKGLRLSSDFMLLTALPLTVFFLVLGDRCLEILYGSVSGETLWSLRLLTPTLLLIGCSNLLGIQILTPLGKERTVMVSTVIGALVDLIADLLLIPRYGAPGAALGTLIAETVVLAVQFAVCRKLKLRVMESKNAGMIAFAAIAAVTILFFARILELSAIKTVLLGGVGYFGGIYISLLALDEPVLKEGFARLRRKRMVGAAGRSEESRRLWGKVHPKGFKALETTFLLFSGIYMAYMVYSISMFPWEVPKKAKIVLLGLMVLVAGMRVLLIGFKNRKVWIGIALCLVYGGVYYVVRDSNFLFLAACTMGYIDVDYQKVIRTYLIAVGVALAIVVAAAIMGWIKNLTYGKEGHIRRAMGTIYPTDFASLVLFLLLFLWVALRKVPDWLLFVLPIISFVIAWKVAYSVTSMVCSGLFFGVIVYHMLDLRVLSKHPQIRVVSDWAIALAVVVFASVMITLTLAFGNGATWAQHVDTLMSNRLLHASNGIRNHGIHPFGSLFELIGLGESDKSWVLGYNFIDCSYLLILIRYGYLLILAVLALWICGVRRAQITGDRKLALVMALIAFHAISEHHLIELHYNIALAIPVAGFALKQKPGQG